MLKMDKSEATYFEDGSLLEWFEGTNPVTDRRTRKCSLKQAIQFVWETKRCLSIQPMEQNSCIFIDYTEK